MTGKVKTTTVQGKQYKYWSDFIKRATFAEDENGNIKKISGSYIANDLTVRKAIANAYGLASFKK